MSENNVSLTEIGRKRASLLIRTHRLWELYLVNNLGFNPDHVHDSAEVLEHFTKVNQQEEMAKNENFPKTDPHGKIIP